MSPDRTCSSPDLRRSLGVPGTSSATGATDADGEPAPHCLTSPAWITGWRAWSSRLEGGRRDVELGQDELDLAAHEVRPRVVAPVVGVVRVIGQTAERGRFGAGRLGARAVAARLESVRLGRGFAPTLEVGQQVHVEAFDDLFAVLSTSRNRRSIPRLSRTFHPRHAVLRSVASVAPHGNGRRRSLRRALFRAHGPMIQATPGTCTEINQA